MKQNDTESFEVSSQPVKSPTGNRTRLIIGHLLKKVILIFVVIFVGIFLTIILINRSVKGNPAYKPQLDSNIRKGIDRKIQVYEMEHQEIYSLPREERRVITDAMREELIAESGLNEPYLVKNLLWTFNALSFKWVGYPLASSRQTHCLANMVRTSISMIFSYNIYP